MENAMAPHSSTLAWTIPWMEEPGGLQAMGLQRVGHDFTFTFHFPALEKEMATHSSVLAWEIPGTAEPGGLLSMGLHRVGHHWSDLAAAAVSRTLWSRILLLVWCWAGPLYWFFLIWGTKSARISCYFPQLTYLKKSCLLGNVRNVGFSYMFIYPPFIECLLSASCCERNTFTDTNSNK